MAPIVPDLDTDAATIPARYPAWSSLNVIDTYFGRSFAASPLHENVASSAPVSSTHGAWSTPMNQMSGLTLAALVVPLVRLNPTVTMMSNFWSTKSWMSFAYSDWSFGTTDFGSAAPMSAAPCLAP